MPASRASSESSWPIGMIAVLMRMRSAYPTAQARNNPDRHAAFCELEKLASTQPPYGLRIDPVWPGLRCCSVHCKLHCEPYCEPHCKLYEPRRAAPNENKTL